MPYVTEFEFEKKKNEVNGLKTFYLKQKEKKEKKFRADPYTSYTYWRSYNCRLIYMCIYAYMTSDKNRNDLFKCRIYNWAAVYKVFGFSL